MPKIARRGPGRPPAAKSAQTRGRILRAAREVFGEMGYEAATFQEIAARADLTRPAINHYYPSKEALYRYVLAETNGVVIASGLEKAEAEETLAGRVHAFVRAAVMLVAALWGLGFYAGFVGGDDRVSAVTDEFIRLLDGGSWKRTG